MLLEELTADTLIADKGYDVDERVIERLEQQGKTAVIPPKRNRTLQREYDKDLYKVRQRKREFFCPIKTISSDRHTLLICKQ